MSIHSSILFRGRLITIGLLLFLIAVSLLPELQAGNSVWKLDREKSSIKFIASSRLAEVPGVFHQWEYDITVPTDVTKVTGTITVQVKSIDTKNRRRDDHLRNQDFFEVEKFPTAAFEIKSVEADENKFKVTGTLTIKGVTKTESIQLQKKVSDNTIELKGQMIIDRFAYGINYNSIKNPIEQKIPLRVTLLFSR